MAINSFWKKSVPSWLAIIVLLAVATAAAFVVKLSSMEETFPELVEITKEAPEPVPSKIIPIASGRQAYEIMTNASRMFKISEVVLDPLDVKQREVQTVTALVEDRENEPITQENRVEAVAYTDNTSIPFSFSLKKVEDINGATVTTWEGSWIPDDTYEAKYMITIRAEAAEKEHSIDLIFR